MTKISIVKLQSLSKDEKLLYYTIYYYNREEVSTIPHWYKLILSTATGFSVSKINKLIKRLEDLDILETVVYIK